MKKRERKELRKRARRFLLSEADLWMPEVVMKGWLRPQRDRLASFQHAVDLWGVEGLLYTIASLRARGAEREGRLQ